MADGTFKQKNAKPAEPAPGDGLRSLQSTTLFKTINFELFIKPNQWVMALGLVSIIGCSGYIFYMRKKYEDSGHYIAIEADGKQRFKKKVSKWEM